MTQVNLYVLQEVKRLIERTHVYVDLSKIIAVKRVDEKTYIMYADGYEIIVRDLEKFVDVKIEATDICECSCG
jgi:hypothetical protein